MPPLVAQRRAATRDLTPAQACARILSSAAKCRRANLSSSPSVGWSTVSTLTTRAAVAGAWVPKCLNSSSLAVDGPDDQYFAGIPDGVGDGLVVSVIFRRPARTDRAVLVVQVLVLRLRMDDAGFGVVGIELDDVRFAMVDPDDAVVVAHCAAFRLELPLYCRAPTWPTCSRAATASSLRWVKARRCRAVRPRTADYGADESVSTSPGTRPVLHAAVRGRLRAPRNNTRAGHA